MDAVLSWFGEMYAHLGYAQIFFLMALESSVFPVPSELVMIPAGYLAHAGSLDPALAVLAGAAGSLCGASVNYLAGRTLGRGLLLKYGRYVLFDERKYRQGEKMFLDNANLATFVGRLLPVVRHLISLPAGVFAMPPLPFAVLTLLGAALWCSVLVAAGWFFGEPAVAIARHYTHELTLAIVAALAAFIGWFLWKGTRA
jgi:membrane protein DedA with SNARE-associated domain